MNLKDKMYVRFPADNEDMRYPRIFMGGQIIDINEFEETVTIRIHDPIGMIQYYDQLPKGSIQLPINKIRRSNFFKQSIIIKGTNEYEVLSSPIINKETKYYEYYAKNIKTRKIEKLSECDVITSFTNARINPLTQLKSFELQNPCWYFGRNIVSKCVNVLDNSIYGFKELTGAKIYLLPHQVKTIMRCLQEVPCRYMLADEVGLGKTIEAISIYKIFSENNSATNALVIVPKSLVEQWKTELFFKFNIFEGKNKYLNNVIIIAAEEIQDSHLTTKWDFVIIDEVHKYLSIEDIYNKFLTISKEAGNLLLLSATPIQEKKFEYLNLLKLLSPQKYSSYDIEMFDKLLEKQSLIIQYANRLINYIDDLDEECNDAQSKGDDPHDSEDCFDIYEDIESYMNKIVSVLNDNTLTQLKDSVSFDNDDCGIYNMRVFLSYVCGNYQIESNIIRNRRSMVNREADDELLATRELAKISYDSSINDQNYEDVIYNKIDELLKSYEDDDKLEISKMLLTAFFSSSFAFKQAITNFGGSEDLDEIRILATQWTMYENELLSNMEAILDDPYIYDKEYNTRVCKIMDYLVEEVDDSKVVLFTNFDETFEFYKKVLSSIYADKEISFFGKNIPSDELELGTYRFQNSQDCKIMLCDSSGGEGRNFQCADYIVHIDLPWDANQIEQRIGRLDRLERDSNRLKVISVIAYSQDKFEEALLKFWDEGINIFNESLSGMEIITSDINKEIIDAINESFEFGLFDRIPKMLDITKKVKETIKREQRYDTAAMIYRPMYIELSKIINYFNQNESGLFASAMLSWASFAGFKGSSVGTDSIVFSPKSFAPRSAYKALLVPPKWDEYMKKKQVAFLNRIMELDYSRRNKKINQRSIMGTFSRKSAIENDYIKFFSPGDEVFDCIVNNAMQSTKGTCSGFAVKSKFNWKGLVFTWKLLPNENVLYEHNISLQAMSTYRNFLATNSIFIPVSLENNYEYSDDEIIKEFNRIMEEGFNKSKTVSLGKRSSSFRFLGITSNGMSNIEWTISNYNQGDWDEIIDDAKTVSRKKALEVLKAKTNLKGARDEMRRVLSSKASTNEYYGIENENIRELKSTLEIILSSLSKPLIQLDSVALVWMVEDDE